MALLPEWRSKLIIPSLANNLRYQGKVRDVYNIPRHPDWLLQVATNSVSIFDIILGQQMDQKGAVLTAITHFWFQKLCTNIPHHLVASSLNSNLNAVHDIIKQYPDIPLERALVVAKKTPSRYELIFRRHLGGSAFKEYQATCSVAGQPLLPGLPQWAELPKALFTPSTKAHEGHDTNISVPAFFTKTGDTGRRTVALLQYLYEQAYDYARERGILLLDTKFEVSWEDGKIVIIDEIFTPDSSRYMFKTDWLNMLVNGTNAVFKDKQVIRDWGLQTKTPFVDNLQQIDATNKEHVWFVQHKIVVPDNILRQAQKVYLDIFERLPGKQLGDYQYDKMGIKDAPRSCVN
ncbi:phosphoribosylaminoimidazolesuccinocarboxamide synthase [Candidatus Falkowbacteria bacterium CG10_big_fil_rev_8_21_14_0_10_43_11]|uniref:phosphoribosylaminoimidazolesuccinocarboxamide synthase n=1 Tax=Candidatus Falkowbacteria bacterium CG10_big_fil_rev_8_21_14_0_10_43_11 TaxID=1974568 RepID=A0A2M6WL49_9BACT|nr:MAG: phosphoribosylaminoimidazolesuccinocarboxamide synthase [Candidatus Falkowbacteria bacterium CG10_big_fil_rev_8_21_14_0_10_43_11]